MKKLDRHLCYLIGRLVIFSLFSDKVAQNIKIEMAEKLKNVPREEILMGKPELPRVYLDSNLFDFVNEESWLLFDLLDIQPEFLMRPYHQWSNDLSYQTIQNIVKQLKVVNEAAEQMVKLGQDYKEKIVKK